MVTLSNAGCSQIQKVEVLTRRQKKHSDFVFVIERRIFLLRDFLGRQKSFVELIIIDIAFAEYLNEMYSFIYLIIFILRYIAWKFLLRNFVLPISFVWLVVELANRGLRSLAFEYCRYKRMCELTFF